MTGRRREAVLVAVAVAAIGGVTVSSLELGGTSSSDEPARPAAAGASATAFPADSPAPPGSAAEAWREVVLADYRPLASSSFSAIRTIVEWGLGRATAADVAARVDLALPSIRETQQALAARKPFAPAPQALVDYRAATALYLHSMQTVRVATVLPPGPLQDQLRRSAARIRDLGDRVFDQASVVLEPYRAPGRDNPDVELRKPAEVPDYAASELGVGPPLESSPASPGQVREYQQTRPVQPLQAWLQAVARVDVPVDSELSRHLAAGSASELAALARRLVAASDALHALPDPQDERLVSTQVQLSLLVQAEAARAAQAAILVSGASSGDLRTAAEGLAGVGDQLWDVRLGVRRTVGGPAS